MQNWLFVKSIFSHFACIGSEPRQYLIDPSHCPLFIRSISLAFNPSVFCQIMLYTFIIKKHIPFVKGISTIFTLSLQSNCHHHYSPTYSAFNKHIWHRSHYLFECFERAFCEIGPVILNHRACIITPLTNVTPHETAFIYLASRSYMIFVRDSVKGTNMFPFSQVATWLNVIRAYYMRLQTDVMPNKNPHKNTYVLGKFMWNSYSLST